MFSEHEEAVLCRVITLAQQWSGCNFTRYNSSTLRRRVERRMIDVRCQSVGDYLVFLENHPSEYRKLISAMTIKVSHFFRDPEVFTLIERLILPKIMERTTTSRRAAVRIWSSACASGEEAYSLAILIAELLDQQAAPHQEVTILATDLDCDSLAFAAEGIYHEESLRHVPESIRNRYFRQPDSLSCHYWQVTPELRRMVSFVSFDLTNPSRLSPPSGIFSEYDFILCRNMLIYCQHSLKVDILRRFYLCLCADGYLALGRSESLPQSYQGHFCPVDSRLKIYLKKEML
ncbi:MAG: protein-glutamate O-methyltransferase CheR [Proteobacteria bacterium]|nr:protein-glutamate O-methyltransferase CheR [Desulfobulbaceae bacterium]MBU4152682.1 protein-glutamate O-methyltransferase CheR [Pseudomonadota bacterium]MDP2105688.1 protein-glutamate O-methyltransferase CheR [Desulfobulbaceae bacterium]